MELGIGKKVISWLIFFSEIFSEKRKMALLKFSHFSLLSRHQRAFSAASSGYSGIFDFDIPFYSAYSLPT
jgi:hypothetical protein